MVTRLEQNWRRVQESLWFVPGLMTIFGILLASALVELDLRLSRDIVLRQAYIAFSGGVDGARGVLTAIASTTITVTGVVFSLTVVALQLAASHFSPRVLRSFSQDRVTQVTMGAFISTFSYSLIVLRNVRAESEDSQTFIPAISVGVAILLILASTGLLIFYIHHVARSIQAPPIFDRIAKDANKTVERLFPDSIGEAAAEGPRDATPTGPAAIVRADRAGYLQAVTADSLFSIANDGGLVVRMEANVGDFVLPGTPLASVWPASALSDDRTIEKIREAFALGFERTLQHDASLAIRQLADIGIKALSPGINDPTTATMCIDRLAEVMVNLGRRKAPDPVRRDDEGSARFIAREMTFERALQEAFAQIRQYGASDSWVVRHLLTTLGRIGAAVPEIHRAAIETQMLAAIQAAQGQNWPRVDVAQVEAAAARARALLLDAPLYSAPRPERVRDVDTNHDDRADQPSGTEAQNRADTLPRTGPAGTGTSTPTGTA